MTPSLKEKNHHLIDYNLIFDCLFGCKKLFEDTQLAETKEVNSNRSLNGSIRSVKSQDQQKDSSDLKTGISVTESVQQRQSISETKGDEGAEGLRIVAGAEGDGKDSRDFNGEMLAALATVETTGLEERSIKTENSTALSCMKHASEEHCFIIGSNWREFYSVPILNACNVALCSSGRVGRCHLRNRLFIKKCRNKKSMLPKETPKVCGGLVAEELYLNRLGFYDLSAGSRTWVG
ncbi:unnamed protein product [Onchocerca flexuosa]|uniref:PPM-type phosphatase domain-containing protein n=1 Tax=Onchocerca flexuosa TaxID=387005 RepID=A0A183HF07_9BILA|nr:unnamed protein product [Onchocerca flexuosa]